jgi:hypothetical protein
MAEMRAGRFKGRGIKGSEQYGEAGANKTLQIAVDLNIPELGRSCTTFLYLSAAAAPYSIERLRALGWKGTDIRNLEGIDTNEVDVEVRSEMYENKQQWRVEILTGPGRVVLQSTVDKDAFAARLAALGITTDGSSASEEPPF